MMLKRRFIVQIPVFLLYIFILPSNAQEVTPIWVINQKSVLDGEAMSATFCTKRNAVVCMTRRQVVAINKSGDPTQVTSLMPGQRSNVTKGGKFINLMTYDHDDITRYEIRDLNNDLIGGTSHRNDHICFLSGRDAQMIIGVTFKRGRAGADGPRSYHFYDMTNPENWREHTSVEDNNPTNLTLAPDGNALVINDLRNGLRAYSPSGSQLWAKPESYKYFRASAGAQRVIGNLYGRRNEIVLLKPDGTAGRATIESAVLRLAISPNGEFAAAADATTLHCFDGEMDALWSRHDNDELVYVHSISIADNGLLACGMLKHIDRSGPPPHGRPEGIVLVFERNGRILWQESFDLERTSAWIPEVELAPSTDGNTILMVKTREEIHLYTIG